MPNEYIVPGLPFDFKSHLYDHKGTPFEKLVGYDVETHYVEGQSPAAARAVCGTFYIRGEVLQIFRDIVASPIDSMGAELWENYIPEDAEDSTTNHVPGSALIVGRRDIPRVLAALEEGGYKLAIQNAAFDVGQAMVIADQMSKIGSLAPLNLLDFYDRLVTMAHEGRIIDPGVRSKLGNIAMGTSKSRNGLDAIVKRLFKVDIGEGKKQAKDLVGCEECGGEGELQGTGFKDGEKCLNCNGTGAFKPWRYRYGELCGVPFEKWPYQAKAYAIDDSFWAVEAVYKFAGNYQEPILIDNHTLVDDWGGFTNEVEQVRTSIALMAAAVHGFRTNKEFTLDYREKAKEDLRKAEILAREKGVIRANGTQDTKYLKRLIAEDYIAQGLTPPNTLKKEEIDAGVEPPEDHSKTSTNRETLLGCTGEFLQLYAWRSKAMKEYKTYVPAAMLGIDHAIVSSPGILKESGRLSWSKPGLHQPPQKGLFRKCFRPRDGFVFMSCDWTAAELVALAQINFWMFGYSAMGERINAGIDLHTDAAAAYNGWDYDWALAQKNINPKVGSERKTFKALNFTIPGGGGAGRLAGMLKLAWKMSWERIVEEYGREPDKNEKELKKEMSVKAAKLASTEEMIALATREAGKQKRGWLDNTPEMQDYFAWIGNLCGDGFGVYKQFVSDRIRGGVGYCDGCNTGFQGLVADAISHASFMVFTSTHLGWVWTSATTFTRPGETEERSVLFGSRTVLVIHDEIIMEVKEDVAEECAKTVENYMIWALQYFCPDMRCEAPAALSYIWEKGAEPVYDKTGKLIPWVWEGVYDRFGVYLGDREDHTDEETWEENGYRVVDKEGNFIGRAKFREDKQISGLTPA